MYNFLIGKLEEIKGYKITLLVNDSIGYEIFTNDTSKFIINQTYKIHIYDYIKEEKIYLCGFLDSNDLKMFKLLIEINGIGPKTALTILRNTNYKELSFLIKSKNKKELSKIQGIGNKAELLIYSLYSKLDDFDSSLLEYENIYLALKALGYNTEQISFAVTELPPGLTDDQALKLAIRSLSNVKPKQ